jgi:hypothetical protein
MEGVGERKAGRCCVVLAVAGQLPRRAGRRARSGLYLPQGMRPEKNMLLQERRGDWRRVTRVF